MKNLSRLQSLMSEIATNLRLADDWRTSEAYSRELLAEAIEACKALQIAADAVCDEIAERLEENQ